jgi:hypothetical protein
MTDVLIFIIYLLAIIINGYNLIFRKAVFKNKYYLFFTISVIIYSSGYIGYYLYTRY